MRRRIASIGGVTVWLHPAALAFAGYMALMGNGWMLAAAFVSILLHEAAHALTAWALGWPAQAIEIAPLGAVMQLDEEGEMPPFKRLVMLLAGPAMTLLLTGLAYHLTRAAVLPRAMGRGLFCANLALILLNLLPVLPLDGGRLLAMGLDLLLPMRMVGRIMRVAGILTGMALIAGNIAVTLRLGGLNLSLALAGCFLMYAAAESTTAAALRDVEALQWRRRRLLRRGMCWACAMAVRPDTPLRQAVLHLPARRWTEVLLLTPEGGVRTRCGETALIEAYMKSPVDKCSRLADKTCQSLRL